MTETMLCRHCLKDYPTSQIVGVQATGIDPQTLFGTDGPPEGAPPWSEVGSSPTDAVGKSAWWRKKRRALDDAATKMGGGYDPYCPKGHVVIDALADKPFVITIAGNVGAAKSTYLLAVAAEIYTAGRLGITSTVASLLPSQVDPLKQKLVSVYNDGQPLPPTPEGEIHEGYVARLQFENGERRSLALYDVPGEVIRSVQKVAQSGRFLYTSDAIILLLDPDGFPDPNAFLKPAVEGVEMAGPQMVHNLADGIEQATGQRVKVPFIVAISKSDKIVDWPAHAAPIGFPAEVQKYLEDESDIVRNMLVAQGLEPVVTAALSRFGAERTRFARVSALGMDYEHLGYGGSMKPDGCWRPIALALLLGRV